MQYFPKTIIIRHRKENLKKCSLRGLESSDGFAFSTYPEPQLPSLAGYILLALDAPIISDNDIDRGLCILDGTWRYAEKMYNNIPELTTISTRSIPCNFITAYPRRQLDCPHPDRGLASIEAIFVAYHIMGRDTSALLDNYYWKDLFLSKNGL